MDEDPTARQRRDSFHTQSVAETALKITKRPRKKGRQHVCESGCEAKSGAVAAHRWKPCHGTRRPQNHGAVSLGVVRDRAGEAVQEQQKNHTDNG